MNNGQKSLSINETFIIEPVNDGTMSACTGFFTNALVSCTGNTQILLGDNIIEANSAFSATTFYGDGSNLTGISTQDIFVTGGTYNTNTGVATFTNNTGGTFSLTDFYTGATDVYVTGGTYYDGVTTFTNNTGGTFTINGPSNYDAGVIFGAENWVDNGDGSIDLPEIKVALYDNPNNLELLKIYTVASGTTGVGGVPPLTNDDTNYIIVEYNNGSPRYNVLDNDGTVDNSDIVLYMIVYRANNFVHTLEFGNMGAGLPNKLTTRLIATDRFARESGCALGLSGSTGVVTLSSGVVWNGPYRQIVTAVNSQDDVFFKSFHSGGTWTYVTTGDTINNSFYDDGTNLVSATAGKYLVNWYFRGQEVNDHLYELISYGQYDTVQLAEASPEPNLPELITSHAFLVGRIIVAVSATTGITQSAFNTVFQPSGAPVLHNDLAGIQGGIAGEYYHLDSNKYNNLALTNTNNNFSVEQSFSSGLTANTISASTYENLPIKYYAEYSIPPTTSPIASGSKSIAIGDGAVSASDYMFVVGENAGVNATGATNSNFLGGQAGYGATDASYSNFFGFQSGFASTNANNSNFFGNQAGGLATNAYYSNFIGVAAGNSATNASNSNFFGQNAGYQATDASSSNFLGGDAGNLAINAAYSNFLGASAGLGATNANNSNFLGNGAGEIASDANNSNFLGNGAGGNATNASDSNFLGRSAGYQATSANNSNFLGQQAGYQATNATQSNFIGTSAGDGASGANNSNFFGTSAGSGAVNAYGSNFFGYQAGYQATDAQRSNFLGQLAGQGATNAYDSNFLGAGVGSQATNAYYSNFFGNSAGANATNAFNSNFLGGNAGEGASSANNSNFLGYFTGNLAINANNSNFLGVSAGANATDANNSNFFGVSAGNSATGASNSNFFGVSAGFSATNAQFSNFLGLSAGRGATTANNSNFLGQNAGSGATNANSSNFLGANTGRGATNAVGSNFIGNLAGLNATNASSSNFIGPQAGFQATSANRSNFIGENTGLGATTASYSNFLGFQTGSGSTGSNNIIIGTNISLTGSNSINIGGVLFGTGTYNVITGTPSISAQTNGRIGINVVSPQHSLHVSGNTFVSGSISATTLSATTYQNLPLDIRVTGGTFSSGTAVFTNNTGGTFSVTGFATQFTGGTVSGATVFTNGLTANTFSATSISATSYNGYTPLPTEAASSSGLVLSFVTDTVYGTLATPETGTTITADTTNGLLGVTNIIIHSGGTAPTFSSEYKKLSGSGNYTTNVVNYIFCTYITPTEIIYAINQRT